MVGYRCYVLDAEDHIVQAHELDCTDDRHAVSAAADLLARDPYHRSAEVWRATRRVRKLERGAALGLRTARRMERSQKPLTAPI
jgi:hypothetical protein